MTDSEIVWEEPSSGATSLVSRGRLAPLMDRPGEWAVLRHGPNNCVESGGTYARKVAVRVGGRWEFTTRRQGDGTAKLYGRYLGPEDAE